MSLLMSRTRRGSLPRAGAMCLLVAAVLTGSVQAAGVTRQASSLEMIPADAAFYSAMLRNREQLDLFLKSKAFAKLRDMPTVQLGWQWLQNQYDNPDGQFAQLKKLIEEPENQQLLRLLGDAFSHEIFFYGGPTTIDTSELITRVMSTARYGPALWKVTGAPKGVSEDNLSGYAVFLALSQNLKLIKVPELIVGFKLSNNRPAEAQIKRLEEVLKPLLDEIEPLKGKLERVKVGGNSFLSLALDGSMIPWDDLPIASFESKPGEFKDVIARLKTLKLSISLGVRGKYLLLAIGSSPKVVIERLGKGPLLEDRAELKPLARFSGRPLTSISYVSKALAVQTGTSREDIDNLAEMARAMLEKAELKEEQRKAIDKDLDDLAKDIKKLVHPPGATLSFSLLTKEGYEGYDYDHGQFPNLDGSKPLTLLNHVGGNPILALVGRSKNTPASYALVAGWLRKVYGHVEGIVLDKLEADQKKKYQEISTQFLPLLRRLDEVTAKMLLPALADEQVAFVLDARWKSKQWFSQLPVADKPLPMLEAELVFGVSDTEMLEKALKNYRKVANEMLAAAHKIAPDDVPEIKLPGPKTETSKSGTLHFYPLPEKLGIDRQVEPTVGLSEKVFVVAPSRAGAERCLARIPLAVESGPLADRKRPLAGASYFNFPALMEVFDLWVAYGLNAAPIPENPVVSKDDIIKQVHTVFEVLSCFRGRTSATYFEGGTLVTHWQAVFRDL